MYPLTELVATDRGEEGGDARTREVGCVIYDSQSQIYKTVKATYIRQSKPEYIRQSTVRKVATIACASRQRHVGKALSRLPHQVPPLRAGVPRGYAGAGGGGGGRT